MTRRAAKRRIRSAAKPETRAASSPDSTVGLPYEERPRPGRKVYRFQFRDGYVDVDAIAWDKKGDEQKLRAFGPIAEELRQTSTELYGIKQERRGASRHANKKKAEKADDTAREFAKVWNAACEDHPGWTRKMISNRGEVAALKLTKKQLENRLSRARKLGLIPARHRRRKP